MKEFKINLTPSQKGKKSSLRLRYSIDGIGRAEKSIKFLQVVEADIFESKRLFDSNSDKILSDIIFDATQYINNGIEKTLQDFQNELTSIIDDFDPNKKAQKKREKEESSAIYNIVDEQIKLRLKSSTLAKTTKENMKSVLYVYNEYEKANGKLSISDLDFSFMPNFEDWLMNNYKFGTGVNVQQKVRTLLRKYFEKLNDYEKSTYFSVRSTMKKRNESKNLKKAYITKEEIYKIYSTDFSYYVPQNSEEKSVLNNYKLNDIRNWIVIGYSIGQRISDLMSMGGLQIDNGIIPSFHQQKTNKIIPPLPIYGAMKHYFQNNNFTFPPIIEDLSLFNLGMRIICREMGMNEKMAGYVHGVTEEGKRRDIYGTYERWQLISSHTMRRSFITHQQMNNRDKKSAMAMSGHDNMNTFDKYDQTSDHHLIQQFYNNYLLKYDDDYTPPTTPNSEVEPQKKVRVIQMKAS